MENQFAFPTRIASVDDGADVFAADEFAKCGQLGFGFGNRFKRKFLWQNGKGFHCPAFVFVADFFRVAESDQMTQRPGNDIAVVFVVVLFFFEFTTGGDCSCQIGGDARFFGDDQN